MPVQKKFHEGKWRAVRADGSIGPPCPPPTDAEREEMRREQERRDAAPATALPEPLGFGETCPVCRTRQVTEPSADRCGSCGAVYTRPPPRPVLPGTKRYKVLTQRDEWFMGKFSPEKLEEAVNHYAAEGWRVVGVATADVGAIWGSLMGGQRQEIVVFMERAVE